MSVVVKRLLIYRFPDTGTAIKNLENRSVKGIQRWGEKCFIKEAFYYDSAQAEYVLNSVLPSAKASDPPEGAKEVD